MNSLKIGLLSTMLIAILSAFATKAKGPQAVNYYQKNTATGACTATACRPTLNILCEANNTEYYQSDTDDQTHCFTQLPLYHN